ncbi:F0F1 ATP synthase subunit B [Candidatus Curtissbacteria bacterium]|nr:F0F1 ATP synthase subunit B [Candidatus Curtissbacteria bacterium]
MEIITKQFGIEPTLLLAQIVNFLIILFVLKKFFYKPIVKMLDERRTTIGESLKNAEEIEAKLKSTEEKTASILKSAQDQSQKIIESAQDQATKIAENAQIEAKKSTEQTIADAIEQIQQEKAQIK